MRSRSAIFRTVIVFALSTTLLGGCGKGPGATSSGSGQAGGGSAPASQGVVSVATKNTTRLGGANPESNAAAVAEAVYPGLTPATRPQAAVLVDARNWPAALATSSLASAPLGAPILYAEGDSLPEASAAALHAMRPVGASALGGAQVIRVGTSAAPADHLASLAIPGPRETASDGASLAAGVLVQLERARGGRPHEVIVVPSDAPRALQMPAAALAAESGAPILFVDAHGVPAATATALAHLGHPTIYAVGAKSLSARVATELGRAGTVVHVSGTSGAGGSASEGDSSNPVDNAIAVSRFAHGTFGWGIHEAGHGLVFANASQPLDAPAAAALSAHGDYGPLLLLSDSASVPSALTRYLSDIEPGYTTSVPPVREVYNHGWLIGDEHAISALAQAEIDTLLEIAPRKSSPEEQSVLSAE